MTESTPTSNAFHAEHGNAGGLEPAFWCLIPLTD